MASRPKVNKRNEAYWNRRFEMLEEARKREADQVVRQQERAYRQAIERIEGDIARWYQRLADNNDISLAEAKRLLDLGELAEFKWSVDEYIQYARKNAINQQWLKELENASARVHISRLDAMRLQMRQQIEVLYARQLSDVEAAAHQAYRESFLHGAYEIQRGTGVGWQLEPLSRSRIDTVIRRPWATDGVTFSDRVWGNKTKLINTLETNLTQALIRGEGARETIQAIAKEMNVARYRAETLVRTEMAYFSSVAQGDCYKTLQVKQYRVVATLDMRTSEICQDMDGKVFPESERNPGVTAYPFHPRCRTTDVPHFDDFWG